MVLSILNSGNFALINRDSLGPFILGIKIASRITWQHLFEVLRIRASVTELCLWWVAKMITPVR